MRANGMVRGRRLPAPLQTVRLAHDPAGFLGGCRDRFGPEFALRLWPVGRFVVVSSPAAVAELFAADGAALRTGEATRRVLPILGERSLPCLDGAEHAERRRVLLPVFGGRRLAAHAARIEAAVEAEVGAWPRGSVSLLPRLRSFALAVAAELVLGERSASPELERRLRAYVAGRAALAAWLPWVAPSRWALERRRRRLDLLLLEYVRRPPPGQHALAALLEACVDPEAVVEELRALLLVAHQSTACALAWAVERLARHPEVLARLGEEEDEYVDAVAEEVLRTRPPVVDAVRQATRPVLLGGCRVPAGTVVMAAPLLVHARADLYPDPDAFRPERFLAQKPPPGAFIPFGGGERRCLGAQLALLELKALLRALAPLRLAPVGKAPERASLVGTAVAPAGGARVVVQTRPG